MKKTIMIISLLALLTVVNAQWEEVGTPGFQQGELRFTRGVVVNSNDVPYVAYTCYENETEINLYVENFDGIDWNIVGNGNIADYNFAYDCNIVIDSEDNIFIAYSETESQGNYWCFVKQLIGNDWVEIGEFAVYNPINSDVVMCIDNYDNIYVYYSDDIEEGAVVKKLNGSDWEMVGGGTFALHTQTGNPSMTVDDSGNIWIAYFDGSSGLYVTCQKFDGTSWQVVGNPGFSYDEGMNTSIITDANEIPYIGNTGWYDTATRIYTYQQNNWEYTALTGSYQGAISNFTKDNFDNVYVSYTSGGEFYISQLDDNGDWNDFVEQPPLSYSTIGVDQKADFEYFNGALYLLFNNYNNGNSLTLLKYNMNPEIEVNPEEFVLEMNSNEIFTDQFTISNIGSGTIDIDYSIDINYLSGDDWMTVDPEFGVLEENETDIIDVTFDTTDLTEGLYQSEIVITYSNNEMVIPVSLTISETDTNDDTISEITKLIGNYPNPFNPTTTITYSLTTESTENTELSIYNLKGQKIKTFSLDCHPELVEGSIIWNGTDDNNQPVSSGVYLYKLQAGEFSQTKKMILMK